MSFRARAGAGEEGAGEEGAGAGEAAAVEAEAWEAGVEEVQQVLLLLVVGEELDQQ